MSKKIPLGGKYGVNKYALVDNEDYARVSQYNWSMHKSGRVVSRRAEGYYLHRFIMLELNCYSKTFLVDQIRVQNCLEN